MSFLTEAQRQSVFDKTLQVIATKFAGPDVDVQKLRTEHERTVVRSETASAFEEGIDALLRSLGTSHTGFFHESRPRATGRVAMAATLMKAETPEGERWVFQDVHPGGVAAAVGISPGDVLIAIDGREVVPPTAVPFRLGQEYALTVRRSDGSTALPTLTIPGARDKKHPIVVPDQVVTARKLQPGIGYMRVSMFPGVLGMDVARDMSRAVEDLGCERLIVDLRGNTGGGIGCLRLMSLLCADRRGVGYSLGREASKAGRTKEQLPAFDRIPASKWGVLPLFVKFARAGRSIAVFTEALGAHRHHGRVAVLVNEHSASAAEMVAAFASEYGLAKIVGARTPGRLVAASAFKVGQGYRVALPVASYYTWLGTNLEGRGVTPDFEAALPPEALFEGRDPQLNRAVEAVS